MLTTQQAFSLKEHDFEQPTLSILMLNSVVSVLLALKALLQGYGCLNLFKGQSLNY